jgi:hypothetical protein
MDEKGNNTQGRSAMTGGDDTDVRAVNERVILTLWCVLWSLME